MDSSKALEGAANNAGVAQPVVPTPTSTGDTLASVQDRYQPYSVGLVQADDPRLEGIDVDKLLARESVKPVSNEARKEFENLPKDPRRVLYYYDEAVAMKEPLLKVLPHSAVQANVRTFEGLWYDKQHMHAGNGTETIANCTNDKISFGQVHWQVAGAGRQRRKPWCCPET